MNILVVTGFKLLTFVQLFFYILKFYLNTITYSQLAGVPGVARDVEYQNRIAILCIMLQKQGDGINCVNVSE
jgi:hypothetical protein